MLRFNKLSDTAYGVHYENSVELGQLLMEVDGYFVFFPECSGGFWNESILNQIAEKLGELNKEWDATVNEYFSQD
jgi:hypothetical protein